LSFVDSEPSVVAWLIHYIAVALFCWLDYHYSTLRFAF